jgi:hypothetical protein
MKTRTLVVAVAAATLFATGYVAAEINAGRHPHMAAAQKYGKQAYDELNIIDKASTPAVDAHINKAKAALKVADSELELAAAAADHK